ncbi:MAG: hypothetical protein ACSHX7_02350 [Luteolibacter sp.]
MKKLFFTLLLPFLSIGSHAQDAFQAPAILSNDELGTFRAWIIATTKTGIRYKTTEISTTSTDGKLRDFTTVYLLETPEFGEAKSLFDGRNYKAAQAKFAEIKERDKPVATLKGNFHTLAAFYEMECMRKLGDYEGLKEALADFNKSKLTREDQLRQLELYVMWEAVRTESWDRILTITAERDGGDLPGYQRAQVAFCKALALDKLKRTEEAFVEYGVALAADSGASEELAQQSALNMLRIYNGNPDVQAAISLWGTEGENKKSRGYATLVNAGKLAKFYELSLGNGVPLPDDLKALAKYAGE